MAIYPHILRPLLFGLDAERAHNLAVATAEVAGRWRNLRALASRCCGFQDARLRTRVAGIEFANPLGLAAGLDKSARAVPMLASLGFGHVEVGSVSAHPSAGNARPRLFRLEADEGIVVNYGLPNDGAAAVAARLKAGRADIKESAGRPPVPVGVNLVKTNDPARPATPAEVLDDYARSLSLLQGCGDYFCLNLSCPNTPDGRDYFADLSRLDALLTGLARVWPAAPIFLKVAPSHDDGRLRELIAVARGRADAPVAGLQINLPPGKPAGLNVTASRRDLRRLPGAVSGRPVEAIVDDTVARLARLLGPAAGFALVAAGGVFDAQGAYRKIRLGASLVQL